MFKLIRCRDSDALYKRAAAVINALIEEFSEKSRPLLLAVPGGRSAAGIFSSLSRENVDWSGVHIFMVDERAVPPGAPDSNFRIVERELAGRADLPGENLHPFIADTSKSDLGAESYREELTKYSSRFDISLLSSGEDGHVAGLFPRHHSIRDDSEFFVAMRDGPKDPPERISSSRKLLLRSRASVTVFAGEEKRDALVRFCEPGVQMEDLPVALVKSIDTSYVITDNQA
jgi:6-phosphogluconolactonase